jgi:hypothetical protein
MLLDKEIKDVRRKEVVAENNIDTLRRLEVKIKLYFEKQNSLRLEVTKFYTYLQNFNWGIIDAGVAKLYDQGKGRDLTDKEVKELKEKVTEQIKEIGDFETSGKDDKELLGIGRIMESSFFTKAGYYKISGYNLISDFKQYLSDVRKAEATVLTQKGYTLNDNMANIIAEFQKELEGIRKELEYLKSKEYFLKLMEEVQMKKDALQIEGKTVEQRAEDFAKLNYLLEYAFNPANADSCEIPQPGNAPKRTADRAPATGNDEKERKIKLAKARAKAQGQRIRILALK